MTGLLTMIGNMKYLLKILLCFILFQFVLSATYSYGNEIYIVDKSVFENKKNEVDCGTPNLKICQQYFKDIELFLDHVKNGDLRQEEIHIHELPKLSDILPPYNFLLEKDGMTYYLPKYIYNPNLKTNSSIEEKHEIAIDDVIIIYYLFERVLFAEITSSDKK